MSEHKPDPEFVEYLTNQVNNPYLSAATVMQMERVFIDQRNKYEAMLTPARMANEMWEKTMMEVIDEDGIASVADAIRKLQDQAARAQKAGSGEAVADQWLIQMRGDYLVTRGVWERPDHRGYTNDINEAGRYSEEEAKAAEKMMPEKCKAVRLPSAHPQPAQQVSLQRMCELLNGMMDGTEGEKHGLIEPWKSTYERLSKRLAQPAQQGSVPAEAYNLIKIVVERHAQWENGENYPDDHDEWIARAKALLSATPQPADNWIKCSERTPGSDDFDESDKVWLATWLGTIECWEIELAEHGDIYGYTNCLREHLKDARWMPTGLKRPNPPAEGAE